MVNSKDFTRHGVHGGRLSIMPIAIILVLSLLLASSGCTGQPGSSQTSINKTLKDQMYSILGINPISVVYQDNVLYVEYGTSFDGTTPQYIIDEMQKVCSFIITDFKGETPPGQVTIQVIADRGKVTYITRMNWNETLELGNVGMSYERWLRLTEITQS